MSVSGQFARQEQNLLILFSSRFTASTFQKPSHNTH